MCKWNEVLDTDKCHRIDESKGRSPYRQGEILRSIFTFNQAGIITSSSLVDLTCRNTWCVTEWRKRPKAYDPEINSAISVQEHVLSEKGSPVCQDLANVQANIFPSFSAHNVNGGVCSVGSCFHNKHQLSLYSGTHPPTCPSNRSRKHVGYSEARQFSSCRFSVRNQPTVIGNKLNAFADQERHISLSRYTALHDIRYPNLMPHYISNVDYNQSVQQYQHGVPNTTHQVTAWNNYAQIPRDYAREMLHQPVLQLMESPLSTVPADVHTEMPSSSEILKTSAQTHGFTNKSIETYTESRLEKTDLCITSRRFECPLCCFKCSNRGQLTGHIRGHTGEKPYECTVTSCGKMFARNEELTRHLRIHSGYRPYLCCQCNKRFSRKDHLTKHVRTHLQSYEKRIYVCLVTDCGQRYTRSDALARHQWANHGIKARSSRNQTTS